jgi:heterodisulfide reductase subunit C
MVFDEVFSEQVFETGKIEDGRVLRRFFQRTGQALKQDWLVNMVKGMMRHLPVSMLARMGLATLVAPKTRGWAGARDAINEYVKEQEQERREALGLDRLVQAAANEVSLAGGNKEQAHG